jgi:branched-subunit amino acid aminotransferase/4-amino-4-deoxychorismate lyase
MATPRSALYGDGLFETMRWCCGSIPLLPWHARRLHEGCIRLGFRVPSTLLDFEKKLRDFLDRQLERSFDQPDCRIRVDVVRNGTGRYLPNTGTVEWSARIEEFESQSWGGADAVEIWLDQSTALSGYHSLSPFKTISAALYVVSAQRTASRGYAESILTTADGAWVESNNSSLFICMGSHWYVPSVILGGVCGVFRCWAVRQMLGWGVNLRYLFNQQVNMGHLDAAFIGNALQGARAVTRIISAELEVILPAHPIVYRLNEALMRMDAT